MKLKLQEVKCTYFVVKVPVCFLPLIQKGIIFNQKTVKQISRSTNDISASGCRHLLNTQPGVIVGQVELEIKC